MISHSIHPMAASIRIVLPLRAVEYGGTSATGLRLWLITFCPTGSAVLSLPIGESKWASILSSVDIWTNHRWVYEHIIGEYMDQSSVSIWTNHR